MRAALLAAAVAAIAGAGCSRLVWSGHDDTRRHRFEVREHAGRQWVERDGVAGPAGTGVGVEALALSADGAHHAYPLQQGACWTIVRDGVPGPWWDGIGFVELSPDGARCRYAAERDGRWWLVEGGTARPLTVEHEPAPCDLEPRPTPAGRAGAVLHQPDGDYVCIDGGRAVGPFEAVYNLQLGSAPGTHCFAARFAGGMVVVANGALHLFDALMTESLYLDPTGTRWAVVAGAHDTQTLFVAIDGRKQVELTFEEFVDAQRRRPNATPRTILRRWAQAELEKSAP